MDPISQACIGSAAAQSGSSKTPLKTALWIGALGGVLPDSDVLIRSATDPLLTLEYHRHFTHSLLFIPLGGLITAFVGKLITRGKRTVRELWLPATLGWATHGLLDSCTSYGTYLLWPFSDLRVAWHSVAIVDLLFTLPIVIGVVMAASRSRRALSVLAFLWALLYLGFGVIQRNRAATVYEDLIAKRGHHADRMEVKPSIGNNILFRAFYIHNDTFFADAVRVPWWGEHTIYEGDSLPALNIAELRDTLDPVHQHDLDRFAYFSNGFLVSDPLHPGFVGDFRYAMVPNAVEPMWGIDVGGGLPGKHLEFRRFTDVSQQQREQLLDQLFGR